MDPLGDVDPSFGHSLQLRFSTQNKQSELVCLKLFTWKMDISSKSHQSRTRAIAWFLVLEKSSTTGDAYKRVGIGCWETHLDLSNEGDNLINKDWRITTIKLI